jgi:hypothetical protein
MTSYSPRIYIYKITFEEVPYYYYGVHKEKVFGEEYWGTPVTHKWCWELYTPKKQILQIFPYTDKGWIEAGEVEQRLIKPFYNIDKWCLNENVGGTISYKSTLKGGETTFKNKKGVFSLSPEERKEASGKGGKKSKENNLGIHGRSKKEMIEHGKVTGKRGGKRAYELGLGVHGRSKEQIIEDGRKGANQKWLCEETGHITNAGALTNYQRKRGIDTFKRRRLS